MTKDKGILIVEDENIVALDMRMRLESLGYRVLDVVDQGDLAVERAAALKPDLVLMDIKLRGSVDGIDAALKLRDLIDTPVVFVTAFTDEKTLERAMASSPYGYVVKPFRERELRIAIELALYKYHYELSMRKAKELAEAANRLKGEFLANMSHELKTPLNSVIGFTQLAMDKAVDAEQSELLGMALRSSKSLLTLIDSILDFTKMEAGNIAITSAPFSLDSVLNDCLDAIAVDAFTKGLEVAFYRDRGVPDSLVGDADRLRHILLNLADNAVKFTDRGCVGISVTPPADAAMGGEGGTMGDTAIVFAVTDTGIGMAPDKIDAAFERFTQLDGSLTRRAGGTGLGLAIVRRSIELMGGSLRVESELGKGTRVEFRLPFSHGPEAAPPAKRPLAGRALLVAGFDESLARGVGEAASSLGATVRYAESPAEAVSGELVVADERAFADPASFSGVIDGLCGRLLVAIRFGGESRERLGDGFAYLRMPVTSGQLARAVESLVLRSRDASGGAVGPARAAKPRPRGKVPHPMTALSSQSSATAKRLLAALAERMELAVTEARLDLAERAIKGIRDELFEAGDGEGERLAFSALLLARKGDIEGVRKLARRVRSAAAGKIEKSRRS